MNFEQTAPPDFQSEFLVLQLARFGDLIQTKRLIVSLQRQGRVTLLVDRSLTALAGLLYPDVQVLGILAHGTHRPDLVQPGLLGSVVRDVEPLLLKDFVRIFNLNYSGLNFALASLFPWERVRGYRMRNGQRLIDSWTAQLMRWVHERSRTGLNLVDAWGMYADHPVPAHTVNPPAVARGEGMGVVMAGRNARRSLPVEILAPLVSAARGRAGKGPVYLLGTSGESRAARDLLALLPPALRGDVRDMTGRTNWQDLFRLVGGLDLLLSPDTGTMHLAAHLGVPVLAFFLSSAWAYETGPYGLGHTVVQACTDCAPCLQTEPCMYDVRCRQAFGDRSVLRYVSGNTDKPVPGTCRILESGFDSLGLIWKVMSGGMAGEQARSAFRAWAGACAGVEMKNSHISDIDEFWVREQDWMLPQTLRGRVHE